MMKRNRKRKRTKRMGAKRRQIAGRAFDTGSGRSKATSKWQWARITIHAGFTKISLLSTLPPASTKCTYIHRRERKRNEFPYHDVVDSDEYCLLMTWFYRHRPSFWRWFNPMYLIRFKVIMIKSHDSGQAFKIIEVNERENTISQLEGTWLFTQPFLSWSWWPSVHLLSSSKVDSCPTVDMIDESMHWLDQFLQEVQGPGSAWVRNKRDRFQGNNNHHDVALVPRNFVEFWV